MKQIGIIGNGFVGEAHVFAFSPCFEIKVYDENPLKSINTLNDVLKCDFVFICVPTPMNEDGSQNIDIINTVFEQVVPGPIYIIKSTVLPGTTKKIKEKYSHLDVVFSPEFLTQRTAKLDMLSQTRIIIGGDANLTNRVKQIYDIRFKNRNYILTDSTTAELIKYMNNCFFATKISIINEFKLVAEKINVNWTDALHGFVSDGRVGDSHLNVPGPDGQKGYGGACFPKDVNAFIKFADSIGIDLKTIKGGWETNKIVRR
jgi:nucleotide sugar dehydrogenase